MEPIPYSFTPTLQDYHAASQVSVRRNKSLTYLRGMMAAVLVLMALTVVMSLGDAKRAQQLTSFAAYTPLLFMAAFIVLLPWVSTVLLWFRLRGNPFLTSHVSGKASDAGLSTTTSHSDVTQQWISFTEVVETKTHFFLVCTANRAAVQMIPKRAFGSQDDIAAFRALVGEQRSKGALTAPPKIRLGVGTIVALLMAALVVIYALMALTRAPR